MNDRLVRVDCEGRVAADASLLAQTTWRRRSGRVHIPRWDDYRDRAGSRWGERQPRLVAHPRDVVYHTLALGGGELGSPTQRRTHTPYGGFAWRHSAGVLADMCYRYSMHTRRRGDVGDVMAARLGSRAYLAPRDRDCTNGEHPAWAPF